MQRRRKSASRRRVHMQWCMSHTLPNQPQLIFAHEISKVNKHFRETIVPVTFAYPQVHVDQRTRFRCNCWQIGCCLALNPRSCWQRSSERMAINQYREGRSNMWQHMRTKSCINANNKSNGMNISKIIKSRSNYNTTSNVKRRGAEALTTTTKAEALTTKATNIV